MGRHKRPNSHHHNGIHVFVTGSGTAVLDGLQIYNNYFHGTTGCCTTAQIFIESPGDGNINATVYNNLLVATIAGSNWNNGFHRRAWLVSQPRHRSGLQQFAVFQHCGGFNDWHGLCFGYYAHERKQPVLQRAYGRSSRNDHHRNK